MKEMIGLVAVVFVTGCATTSTALLPSEVNIDCLSTGANEEDTAACITLLRKARDGGFATINDDGSSGHVTCGKFENPKEVASCSAKVRQFKAARAETRRKEKEELQKRLAQSDERPSGPIADEAPESSLVSFGHKETILQEAENLEKVSATRAGGEGDLWVSINRGRACPLVDGNPVPFDPSRHPADSEAYVRRGKAKLVDRTSYFCPTGGVQYWTLDLNEYIKLWCIRPAGGRPMMDVDRGGDLAPTPYNFVHEEVIQKGRKSTFGIACD